jgi:SAM-dependent methyltransferase
MSVVEKRRVFIPERPAASPAVVRLHSVLGPFVSPLALGLAQAVGMPGVSVHVQCGRLGVGGWRKGSLSRNEAYSLLISPLDSVRYFEFASLLGWMAGRALDEYLDVSSPRLFPALALLRDGGTGRLINPDRADLAETKRLFDCIGLSARCSFDALAVSDASFAADSFDTISSMSVIEHIPEDTAALRIMWRWLRPGGRLYLSMPCARSAFEEYVGYSEYGLVAQDPDGSYFLQRFYDEQLLEDRVFSVVGKPAQMAVYGERRPGLYERLRQRKLGASVYPQYLEPYFMATSFRRYKALRELPGVGVVAMDFIKPSTF